MNLTPAILFLLLVFGLSIPKVYAEELTPNIAVRIIVNEAGNQGLKGMICIGEVLRQRGSIKGFRGYKVSPIKPPPKAVWHMAAKAWKLSEYTYYTKGADHFANIHIGGKPWWARHCIQTYEYKDHVFYKEIRH